MADRWPPELEPGEQVLFRHTASIRRRAGFLIRLGLLAVTFAALGAAALVHLRMAGAEIWILPVALLIVFGVSVLHSVLRVQAYDAVVTDSRVISRRHGSLGFGDIQAVRAARRGLRLHGPGEGRTLPLFYPNDREKLQAAVADAKRRFERGALTPPTSPS